MNVAIVENTINRDHESYDRDSNSNLPQGTVLYQYYADHREAGRYNATQYNGGEMFFFDSQWRIIEEWDTNTYRPEKGSGVINEGCDL